MGNRSRFGKRSEIKMDNHLPYSRMKNSSTPEPGSKSVRSGGVILPSATRDTPTRVRSAEDFDISFIGRLSREVFSIYGPYEEMVPRWFQSKMIHTVIALRDRRPVGFAMLGDLTTRYDLSDVSELLAIAVEPKKQGAGVGETLINEIERTAFELHIKRVFLHTATTNFSARKLFIKKGFSPWEIKRSFYPSGQDAVVMSKEISDPGVKNTTAETLIPPAVGTAALDNFSKSSCIRKSP